jgi:CRISPR-associated protein Csb2
MFVVTVEFLTGRFVATAPEDRQKHEWPPHPARLFSALVAAWADLDDAGEFERAAIEWFERQPAPRIAASEAVDRAIRTHYVPVNDTSVVGVTSAATYRKINDAKRKISETEGVQQERARLALQKARDVQAKVTNVGNTNWETALKLLPSRRNRMPRYYPSLTPTVPRVHYLWSDCEPSEDTMGALDRILAGVTRLGHSSSLVACRVDHQLDTSTLQLPIWIPDRQGDTLLRTTAAGLFRELKTGFSMHQGCRPRTMPSDAQRYRLLHATAAPEEPQVPDNSGEWFVFSQVSGRRLPITAAANLTTAVRAALMRYASSPLPELISGHSAGGASSEHPHLAVVAAPFVGGDHADGHLLGFAILLPKSSPLLDARDEVLQAIGRWEGADQHGGFRVRILLPGGDELWFKRVQAPIEAWSLRRSRWEGPARTWVSATPIALDRHPGNLGSDNAATAARAYREAEESIRTACDHVGIIPPSDVAVTRDTLVAGSRPARSFPAFRGGGSRSPQRLLIHARITFDEDVRGPLLLGAGRYLGLGLMTPERRT